MNITTRTVNDVTVADLSGRLDTRASGPASEALFRIAQGASTVLLNLENLEFISSAGLRVLLRTESKLTGSGGTMKLCGANGIVKQVLEISGLRDLIELHDSEHDALSAF